MFFETDNDLVQVMEHCAILSSCTKLPPVFKTFVLTIYEWLLKTGFTVEFIIWAGTWHFGTFCISEL